MYYQGVATVLPGKTGQRTRNSGQLELAWGTKQITLKVVIWPGNLFNFCQLGSDQEGELPNIPAKHQLFLIFLNQTLSFDITILDYL
jgi:hypothetical protein